VVTANGTPDQSQVFWMIDIDWYEKNNSSFDDLARRGLCEKCAIKVGKRKKKYSSAEIINTIKECCGQLPEYIPPKLPIAESIFRILLASGNQPMTALQISQLLSERRGIEAYSGDFEIITRILKNDYLYGFKQVNEDLLLKVR